MPDHDDAPIDPRVRPLLAGLIDHMRPLSDEQRLLVLEALHAAYCPVCGRDHSSAPYPCQCWNDD